MSCDHNTITDIVLDNGYALVYCDSTLAAAEFVAAEFVTGQVTTAHTVETFATAQELLDRGLALGLQCTTNHLIKAMEHGATLPPDIEALLLSYVWEDEYLTYWERMVALGYEKPPATLLV